MAAFTLRISLILSMVFTTALVLVQVLPKGTSEQIAYGSYDYWSSDVFLKDIQHQLTINLTRSKIYEGSPCWSTDGTKLAFDFYEDTLSGLAIYDFQSRQIRLVENTQGGTMPRWSPDHETIAYAVPSGAFHGDLYFYQVNGGEITRFSGLSYENTNYTWSPDSRYMALTGYDYESWTIEIVDMNEEWKQIASGFSGIGNLTWSPDGSYIAFSAWEQNHSQVKIISTDEPYPITDLELALDGSMSGWSSDSSKLILYDSDTRRLFTVDIDTKQQRTIYQSAEIIYSPVLRPTGGH